MVDIDVDDPIVAAAVMMRKRSVIIAARQVTHTRV
jgi:hypothetical protein